MALITATAITAVQEFVNGSFKLLVEDIQKNNGLSSDEAKDIVANIVIDLALNTATIFTILKSGAGVKVAEYLGFTSKGYAKRKLTAKAEAAATKVVSTTATEVGTSLVKKVLAGGGLVGAGIWLASAIANIIEPGIYKPDQTNAVYKKLGIPFQYPVTPGSLKPGPFDLDSFKDYASAVEAAGILGFEYGFPIGTVLYSRQTLADLINYVYGKEVLKGNAPSAKQLIPLLSPYIIAPKKTTTTTNTPAKTTTTVVQPAKVQVFTGVVSQGVLGNGTVFVPRSNDMIDDVNELISSASINLAGYLAALPSRVIYEIKIVSSVTTKDGFTQRGSTTQIVSGYYANGSPKYKTVTNKFAVLYLYILTDKGTRTKLATVNVGPVNSVNFQPDSNDLNEVAQRLQGLVTTSKVSDITTIVSDTPVDVQTATPTLAPLPNYNNSVKIPNDLGFAFYKRVNPDPQPPSYVVVPDYKFYDLTYGRITEEEYRRATGDTKDYTNSGYQLVNDVFTQVQNIVPTTTLSTGGNTTATTAPPAQRAGANANTLAEWYAANGQSLPTVQARSIAYQEYGLGTSALYIGSAEQNTRLLNKLKGF